MVPLRRWAVSSSQQQHTGPALVQATLELLSEIQRRLSVRAFYGVSGSTRLKVERLSFRSPDRLHSLFSNSDDISSYEV